MVSRRMSSQNCLRSVHETERTIFIIDLSSTLFFVAVLLQSWPFVMMHTVTWTVAEFEILHFCILYMADSFCFENQKVN